MNMKRRMPSLRSLRAFQTAGRHLSFKLAAEELCLTASAISHQVKGLEAFLDLDLFVRKTRALEFTEAGKKYLISSIACLPAWRWKRTNCGHSSEEE